METELSPDFQRSVLRLCMEDEAFCLKAMKFVQPSFFTTQPLGWIFKTLKTYWETYSSRCSDMALRTLVQQLPEERMMAYASEVELVIAKGTVPDADFVRAHLQEFCRFHLFVPAHKESAELFNAKKSVEAYDRMRVAMDTMQELSFDHLDRQWFFEELEARQMRRLMRASSATQGFGTGIHDLDEVTDGGVQYGEVWCVFAYAKRCKTTWLLNQAAGCLRVEQQPVLHFVLEGTGKQISDRYDACFASESYTEIKRGMISPNSSRYLFDSYREKRSKLVIRVLNDWDINVQHLEAEIRDLRSSNFKPKLLIVDYMDLLRSRSRVDSETQHQVNAARDLKRMVNSMEVACWSAWQAQRPPKGAKDKEHVLTSADVADAYAKVRIVDAFGSLNATEDEMEQNVMRFYMEGHRDAPMGKCWKIVNDLARMRMVISAKVHNFETTKKEAASE